MRSNSEQRNHNPYAGIAIRKEGKTGRYGRVVFPSQHPLFLSGVTGDLSATIAAVLAKRGSYVHLEAGRLSRAYRWWMHSLNIISLFNRRR